MDLGSILQTVTQGVVDYQLLKRRLEERGTDPLPQGFLQTEVDWPEWLPSFGEGNGNGGSPPANASTKGLVWNPNANCGKGSWQRRTRRRRKRLATASDINDLAALKSVLGNGETFKMWVATRKM